ncbi:C2H2 type zinc-finger-domain-containing protein [Gigaspora margarita]|uniref:C2H2 type zinc-finger-domain-containing protein n=1 Tax=Gigaspora margarita TaxID=4874 RepID=A0A8H4ASI1_GIGMA|nr:C2H2 type zinc-finger-domain-containing protein [Gigaspora margarita]
MSVVSEPIPRSKFYTCLACQVTFNTAQDQRNHYGTDWHRYNLKRKVVELPPVTYNVFEQKVLAQQAQSKDADEKASFSAECASCKKTYYSENAYANHLRSNKHKVAEIKAVQDGGVLAKKTTLSARKDEENMQEEFKLTEVDCLFCAQKSESFETNLTHMTRAHSFFIPEIEYLVDLQGLIKYLGEKISVKNLCLYCNGRGKGLKSFEAVRQHMMDKGHCKIAYERDEDIMEVSDFYDFTSSYPVEEGSEEWENIDDEWEDIEEDNDDENDDVKILRGDLLNDDDIELILPSGARIGHRSLRRYYKQNLRPEENRDSIIINRLITQYGSNIDYHRRSGGVLLAKGHAKHAQYYIATFQDKRLHDDFDTRVGIKANKLQRHFRAQIL